MGQGESVLLRGCSSVVEHLLAKRVEFESLHPLVFNSFVPTLGFELCIIILITLPVFIILEFSAVSVRLLLRLSVSEFRCALSYGIGKFVPFLPRLRSHATFLVGMDRLRNLGHLAPDAKVALNNGSLAHDRGVGQRGRSLAGCDRYGWHVCWLFHDAIPVRWSHLYGERADVMRAKHLEYMDGLARFELVVSNSALHRPPRWLISAIAACLALILYP